MYVQLEDSGVPLHGLDKAITHFEVQSKYTVYFSWYHTLIDILMYTVALLSLRFGLPLPLSLLLLLPQSLLETRLSYDTPLSCGNSEDLLSRVSVLMSGCDFLSVELLRLRTLGPDGGQWVTQIKEMESFNNDLRQACRKV